MTKVHTIFTDEVDTSEENIKRTRQEMQECRVGWENETEEITDEEVVDYLYTVMQDDFDAECSNLNRELDNQIIAIADIGTWRGRRQGYQLCSHNLKDVLYVGNVNGTSYNHVYYDGYNVRKTIYHHDGTNYVTFRELRPNVNVDKFIDMIYNNEYISTEILNRYTRSLRRYVKEVYGW